jgi:hypothetical protein
MAETKKWAKHAHVKQGGLGTWCEHCSDAERHASLRTVIKKDGAGTVSKRLNFLANVSHSRVARKDQRWVKKNYEDDGMTRMMRE